MGRIKVMMIIGLSIVVLLGSILGLIIGFPWERIIAETSAKRYVAETYGLTPVKATASFLFDTGGAGVYISTKELDFDFCVSISRSNLNYVDNDDYLARLVEHKLTLAAEKELETLLGENNRIIACLQSALTKKSPKGLSIEMINSNFSAAVATLKNDYYYLISFRNATDNDINLNYDNAYEIFKTITNNWHPKSIDYWYYSKDKVTVKICINNMDFDKINSSDDFKLFFESTIKP